MLAHYRNTKIPTLKTSPSSFGEPFLSVNSRVEILGTLGTFEGSVARLLARKLRRISKELTATNQKVGSSNLSQGAPDIQQYTAPTNRVPFLGSL